jgi:hypothetical protein
MNSEEYKETKELRNEISELKALLLKAANHLETSDLRTRVWFARQYRAVASGEDPYIGRLDNMLIRCDTGSMSATYLSSQLRMVWKEYDEEAVLIYIKKELIDKKGISESDVGMLLCDMLGLTTRVLY